MGLIIYGFASVIAKKGKYLATTIINVVIATTFIVQIIGPPCVKFAIIRAGEARLGRT